VFHNRFEALKAKINKNEKNFKLYLQLLNSEIEDFFDSIKTIYINIKHWLFELIRNMLKFDKNERITLTEGIKKISISQNFLIIDK